MEMQVTTFGRQMLTSKALGCTHSAIQNDVPLQIWEALASTNTNTLPLIIIRILHNKLRYYPANYAQCYFHYLSPKFIVTQIKPVPSIIILLLLITLIKIKPQFKKPLIIGLAIYPIIMIFELYKFAL